MRPLDPNMKLTAADLDALDQEWCPADDSPLGMMLATARVAVARRDDLRRRAGELNAQLAATDTQLAAARKAGDDAAAVAARMAAQAVAPTLAGVNDELTAAALDVAAVDQEINRAVTDLHYFARQGRESAAALAAAQSVYDREAARVADKIAALIGRADDDNNTDGSP